jgi:hypothetical protein
MTSRHGPTIIVFLRSIQYHGLSLDRFSHIRCCATHIRPYYKECHFSQASPYLTGCLATSARKSRFDDRRHPHKLHEEMLVNSGHSIIVYYFAETGATLFSHGYIHSRGYLVLGNFCGPYPWALNQTSYIVCFLVPPLMQVMWLSGSHPA